MRLETWFSGGGLVDIGFKLAGLTPARAVEVDSNIAAVYTENIGAHCIVADVRDYARNLDPFSVDWLHVSPPCTNASIAKGGGRGETDFDVQLPRAIVQGIRARKPAFFSLENVWPYRNFQAFKNICYCLEGEGYSFEYWNLNAADYGVPQVRKRLILIASRTQKIIRPFPTHSKAPSPLFAPYGGWLEAVKDLNLPREQAFPAWQAKLIYVTLKRHYNDCPPILVDGKGNSNGQFVTIAQQHDPSFTILASSLRNQVLRCWDGLQVRRLTPRALARLQSVPDSYLLPQQASFAGKIIGNGVPPLLIESVVKQQFQTNKSGSSSFLITPA